MKPTLPSPSHFAVCLGFKYFQILWYLREIVVPILRWNQSVVTEEFRSLHADKTPA